MTWIADNAKITNFGNSFLSMEIMDTNDDVEGDNEPISDIDIATLKDSSRIIAKLANNAKYLEDTKALDSDVTTLQTLVAEVRDGVLYSDTDFTINNSSTFITALNFISGLKKINAGVTLTLNFTAFVDSILSISNIDGDGLIEINADTHEVDGCQRLLVQSCKVNISSNNMYYKSTTKAAVYMTSSNGTFFTCKIEGNDSYYNSSAYFKDSNIILSGSYFTGTTTNHLYVQESNIDDLIFSNNSSNCTTFIVLKGNSNLKSRILTTGNKETGVTNYIDKDSSVTYVCEYGSNFTIVGTEIVNFVSFLDKVLPKHLLNPLNITMTSLQSSGLVQLQDFYGEDINIDFGNYDSPRISIQNCKSTVNITNVNISVAGGYACIKASKCPQVFITSSSLNGTSATSTGVSASDLSRVFLDATGTGLTQRASAIEGAVVAIGANSPAGVDFTQFGGEVRT